MAETMEKVKKAKAPAKPRATAAAPKKAETKTAGTKAAATKPVAAKKQTVAEKVTASTPSHHEIAELARHYWAERGHQDGQHEQDWLRAEQELLLKLAS